MQMRNINEALGFPLDTTTIDCDNKAATMIAMDEAKEKRTRHLAMRLHWTKEKVYEQIFKVRWRPGSTNLADFVTKLHERKDFEDKRGETMVQC